MPVLPYPPPVVTQDDRTMAFLSHLLQIFTGFIAPLVIYLVRPHSRFVKFHALQALMWQLCCFAFFMVGLIFFFISIALAASHAASHPQASAEAPPAFIAAFLVVWLFWLIALALSISNVALAIVYGIKANRGEWAAYPVIGKWCLTKVVPGAPPSAL
jgi:uncharacterized Tic20 family protein